jgi:TonB family protein
VREIQHDIQLDMLATVFNGSPENMVAAPVPSGIAIPTFLTTAVGAATPSSANFAVRPASVFAGIWALGALTLIVRFLFGAIRVQRIVRAAHGRSPILTTSLIRGPFVAGALRPTILLPESAQAWTLSRRRAVIAHERAHIRRRDPAILVAVRITTALYWFHPLCWIAAARLRAESEQACDDAALRLGLTPSGYATHLLELARRFDTHLALPMATTSHLESRVKSILDPMTNHSSVSRTTWLTAAALTLIVLAPLTTFTLRAQQSTGGARLRQDKMLFDNAIRSIDNGDYGAARGILNTLINTYDTSDYLVWAKLTIADSWFREGGDRGIAQAEAEYKDFALFYPDFGDARTRVTVATGGTPPPALSAPVPAGNPAQAPTLSRQVNPVYPADLRTEGIEGTVLLSAIISQEGTPSALKVLNSPVNQEFTTAALAAVSQWRYTPTLVGGQPSDVPTMIQIDFKLRGQ